MTWYSNIPAPAATATPAGLGTGGWSAVFPDPGQAAPDNTLTYGGQALTYGSVPLVYGA